MVSNFGDEMKTTEGASNMSEAQLLRPHWEDHERLIDALRLTLRHIPARLMLEELAALNMALRDATNIVRDEIGMTPVNLHGDEMTLAGATVDA
jgi:hypothetical protein